MNEKQVERESEEKKNVVQQTVKRVTVKKDKGGRYNKGTVGCSELQRARNSGKRRAKV